jgi:hypothetical protein
VRWQPAIASATAVMTTPRARREYNGRMGIGFNRNAAFSKHLDISTQLFYQSKAVDREVSR